jgi:hypothetical protein
MPVLEVGSKFALVAISIYPNMDSVAICKSIFPLADIAISVYALPDA